tara:strand:- start:313 stop:753 length:441 start_codon:yes stop_codon:yes gene_type:complete
MGKRYTYRRNKRAKRTKRKGGKDLEAELRKCHKMLKKKNEQLDYLTQQVQDKLDDVDIIETLYESQKVRQGMGSNSPKKRSASPKKRSASPKKRSASPKKRSASPKKRSASPKKSRGLGHRGVSPFKFPGLSGRTENVARKLNFDD